MGKVGMKDVHAWLLEGDSLALCISRCRFIFGFHLPTQLRLSHELLIGRY
jgi:hypothetical protein